MVLARGALQEDVSAAAADRGPDAEDAIVADLSCVRKPDPVAEGISFGPVDLANGVRLVRGSLFRQLRLLASYGQMRSVSARLHAITPG